MNNLGKLLVIMALLSLGNSCKKALDAPKKAPKAQFVYQLFANGL